MPDPTFGPPPSRSPLPAVAGAAVILAALGGALFMFNRHTAPQLSVPQTRVFDATTEMKASTGSDKGMHVIGVGPSVSRDLYVATDLTIRNPLHLPLFVKEVTATVTRADGSTNDADVILPAQIPQVTAAFPGLAPLVSNPLPRDKQIAPGETYTGTVLFHLSQTTEADWKARKAAALTVNYFHQDAQTVPIP